LEIKYGKIIRKQLKRSRWSWR